MKRRVITTMVLVIIVALVGLVRATIYAQLGMNEVFCNRLLCSVPIESLFCGLVYFVGMTIFNENQE